MKAIHVTKYGPPEVLQYRETEKPIPKDNEVLIRIEATVTAQPDCALRAGKPYISRLFTGITRPKYIPGDVFSGVIEEAGKDVKNYKTGDQVYGSSGTKFGTNAEYITLPENEGFYLKPANISYGEAAAISEGSLTALPFLRDSGMIKKGTRILINGASGGIGVYSIQLAKYYGAEVTAVCSGTNSELVKSLGADHVIDYTKEDFTASGRIYDIIFDTVSKSSFAKCKKLLSPTGKYLATVPTLPLMLQMLLTSHARGKKAVFSATGLRKAEDKKKDLDFLKSLIEGGKLKPSVDRTYSIRQLEEAHAYVEKGHKKGSVVITVSS